MQKKGDMDNENKFYNIYRLCRKEGTWTTRTSSTIYIDYAEKRGHEQREQVLQWSIYIVELVLVVHVPSFLHGLYIL
jgi:hypothetical protein